MKGTKSMKDVRFLKAQPVWIKGREKEMHVNLAVTRRIGKDETLFISASSTYQAFVEGEIIAEGPARAGHGYYRVDEIPLHKYEGKELFIIVAGYNVNAFSVIDVPSFICAETVADGAVTAFTSGEGFEYAEYTARRRRVQRYSFQRPFVEAYDHTGCGMAKAEIARVEDKRFIERGVPYPEYEYYPVKSTVSEGTFVIEEKESYFDDRAISNISPALKGFRRDELEMLTSKEAEMLTCTEKAGVYEGGVLSKNGYAIFDLGAELTGFIRLKLKGKGRVYLTFDEILTDGDVKFHRLSTSSVIIWDLNEGEYDLTSFEAYSLRYIKLAVTEECEITDIGLIGFEYPSSLIAPAPEGLDGAMKRIYDAAIATFRQNTVDIYMDCPSRERAGWLCDSFFTSRVEYALTGRSLVEKNFLENFLMPDGFACLPEGMLPMCYPSDHYDGVFIPNWAMWYVVELGEYLERTNDRELIELAKSKVYALLRYFRGFENKDGLLEKLKSWVFIEWSKSNELVQDINYPTNMLYSLFKETIAALYGDTELSNEAALLKDKIRELSFDGKWFCDNAVYGEGDTAKNTGLCTESCQYYAFFTKVATPELYPELWSTLVNEFGPERKLDNKHPDIFFANAFIGNYLRLVLLFDAGLHEKVKENVIGYFDYMAKKTGTLWENDSDFASCNHGFASHTAIWIRELCK